MTKTIGDLHEDLLTCMTISRCILLRMSNVSDKVAEKTKIHILCPITFFRKEFCSCDNDEKYDTA